MRAHSVVTHASAPSSCSPFFSAQALCVRRAFRRSSSLVSSQNSCCSRSGRPSGGSHLRCHAQLLTADAPQQQRKYADFIPPQVSEIKEQAALDMAAALRRGEGGG
mmetsp:Transcript_15723/g.47372  ORF Transcript_15723/g.47372 Transcript_15723/m.47372 type:complete len:106 (+) Transcript_15723:303-620(+)